MRGASLTSSVRQLLLRNSLKLHVRRAFVDLTDLGVTEEFLDGIFFRETVAAEKIHSHGADFLARLGRVIFRDGRFLEKVLSGILQTSGVVNKKTRGFELNPHL